MNPNSWIGGIKYCKMLVTFKLIFRLIEIPKTNKQKIKQIDCGWLKRVTNFSEFFVGMHRVKNSQKILKKKQREKHL